MARGDCLRIGERIAAYERGRRDAREDAWGRGRPHGSPTLEADYTTGHQDETARMAARGQLPQLALALEPRRAAPRADAMPMDRTRYPANWPEIRAAVLARAGGACECAGECGRHEGPCPARQGDPLASTADYFVVLTTAHLWRGPCAEHDAAGVKCGELDHLKAMCQRCHLSYDQPHHVANARRTRRNRKATGDLFDTA